MTRREYGANTTVVRMLIRITTGTGSGRSFQSCFQYRQGELYVTVTRTCTVVENVVK